MKNDIIMRKRKFQDLDLSFDDRIDRMFDRQWTVGTWALAGIGSLVVVGALLFVGNIVLGLN
jgi:hypothetical protein